MNGEPPLIEGVARYALSAGPPSEQVAAIAQELLLDALGVGIVGLTNPLSAAALEVARGWGEGAQAAVWGRDGVRLPAGAAAFVNAHQIHCFEFDPVNEPAVVHPTSVVLPVLAAWVQRERTRGRPLVPGREFLRAFVVGVEVAAGLGVACVDAPRFFRPATAGALGAVAALCALRHPTDELAIAAFTTAYCALCGTMQGHEDGAEIQPLQMGTNARAALDAVDLAQAGFRGPRHMLEGSYGYYSIYEAGGDLGGLLERLGTHSEVARTGIKPYPSGRATHPAIDAALDLRAEHGLQADAVRAVEVSVPPLVHGLVGREPAADLAPGTARLCLRHLLAAALEDGRVDLRSCTRERLADPAVLDLARRVRIVAVPGRDPNALLPQSVRIELAHGRSLERTATATLGSPERPVDRERLEGKFRDNLAAGGCADRADAIIDAVAGIAALADVTALLDLL